MADYWKSQPRKFCDFCKCWTADNKPSRDFHERGKRHQENVKKKLDDLRKKGSADAKKEQEMSGYLARMEKAAMKKLKEDLASDPSLAAQYGVAIKKKESEAACESAGDWSEAYSPEGHVYYWNSITGETTWELPASLQSPSLVSTATSSKPTSGKQLSASVAKTEKKIKKGKRKLSATNPTTETMTKPLPSVVSSEPCPLSDIPFPVTTTYGPRARPPKPSVYGAWEQLNTEPEPVIDYELPINPADSAQEEVKPVVVPSEPKLKFAEKKATNLDSGGAGDSFVGFKKRKAVGGLRNTRRDDDDAS